MEIGAVWRRFGGRIRQFLPVILVAAVGILLMLLPTKAAETVQPLPKAAEETSLQEQLSVLLSNLEGAGRVEVLLTEHLSQRCAYRQDVNAGGSADTVILTDSSRNQSALVEQVEAPVYRGAVILCTGGNDPKVRLAVVEAVSKATGLGAGDIVVLKAK